MARNQKVITLDDSFKRDAGKSFLITEMPSRKTFKWGCRAVITLINAGVDFPEGSEQMGMAALIGKAFTELKNGLDWEQVEPLMDELMEYVQFIPNTNNLNVTRGLIESDIDEFKTIAYLHKEVLQLHLNFT